MTRISSPATVNFAFVEDWRHVWLVETICRIMRVSARGYHSWRTRPISQRTRTDTFVLAHIREQHSLSLRGYGRPCIAMEFKEAGLVIREHRVGHARSDNQGLPIGFVLTGGDASEYAAADDLMALPLLKPKALLANKGYDSDRFC